MNARRPSFGEALRQARRKKKLTQQALAERIGVSDGTYVGKWERNIIVPSLYYQQKLREVLGNFLDEGTEETNVSKPTIQVVIFPIQIIQFDDPSSEEKS